MTNFSSQNGSADDFDNHSDQPDSKWERWRSYLELNRELFSSIHIENHPQASFFFIAIEKFEGRTWKEISASLDGIPLRTLGRFYKDCIDRFYEGIKDYLNNNNPDNSNLDNEKF
ncbi:hypothetical protein C7B80_02865 [Cyanosarcina cf. burmensis CCALA 770]|nr:hypothetical protein C7B80_02865 [Cyanosarcina cf. burmensis CCALA 770]